MEIIYRANDGTEFYDEDDCVMYERKLEYRKRNLKSRFFDRKGKEMDNTDIEDCYEHAWYAEFASLEEAEFYDKESSELVGGTYFDDKPCVGRFIMTRKKQNGAVLRNFIRHMQKSSMYLSLSIWESNLPFIYMYNM